MMITESKRLFIGLDLPDELRNDLRIAKDKVEPETGGRWIDPGNLHVTLKFLGNCAPEIINDLHNLIDGVTVKYTLFNLNTTEFGCFPSSKRVRILWLGMDGNEQIIKLQNEIEEAIAVLGFEIEKKKFHPHITVARFRNPGKVKLAEVNKMVKIDREVKVDYVILYESKLSSKGANYSIMKKFKLLG